MEVRQGGACRGHSQSGKPTDDANSQIKSVGFQRGCWAPSTSTFHSSKEETDPGRLLNLSSCNLPEYLKRYPAEGGVFLQLSEGEVDPSDGPAPPIHHPAASTHLHVA